MASKTEDEHTDTATSDSDDDRDESSDSDEEKEEQSDKPEEETASEESKEAAKEEPAAKSKPAAKASVGGKDATKKPVHPAGKRPAGAAGVKVLRKPGQAAVKPKPSGSMVKSMILFLIIVGGLTAAFLLLNPPEGGPVPAPKWNTGQTVDVELTLVASDSKDLACASTEEVAGRKCEFETQTKPRPKAEGDDADKKLLKPYTTTDRVQFLAGGVWSDPALKGKLPTTRFSVKCKYTVEGKIKKPVIRWSTDWYEPGSDWYAGVVSACSLVP